MIEEYIKAGKYQDALNLLNDIEDEQVRYLRLVCLYGMKDLYQASREAKIAKESATSTYYDVVALYLSILKDLEEYEEAVNIVIEELSMPYIPYQYESLFNEAYDEILLAKQEANALKGVRDIVYSEEEIERILETVPNEDVVYMAVDQLAGMNIRLFLPSIRLFFRNEQAPTLAKSLLADILIEQQVDEELEMVKNGFTFEFNPYYMTKVDETDAYTQIGESLIDHLESENPSLLAICLEFLNYFIYDNFPREIYEEEYNTIAGAIHYYLATLQYIEVDLEDLSYEYGTSEDEIMEKIQILKQIRV